MKFSVNINILPQDALLDPQGKTIEQNTSKLAIEGVTNVRIGKRITLELESPSQEDAEKNIKELCEKLLVNQITEKYDYKIV